MVLNILNKLKIFILKLLLSDNAKASSWTSRSLVIEGREMREVKVIQVPTMFAPPSSFLKF